MTSREVFLDCRECKCWSKQKLGAHSCTIGPNILLTPDPVTERFDLKNNVAAHTIAAGFPIPVGSPAIGDRAALNGVDPIRNPPKSWSKYARLLSACEGIPLQEYEETLSSAQTLPAYVQIDSNLADLACFISKEKRPYYSDRYDPHYGNTLTLADVLGETVLLYSQPREADCLKLVIPDLTSDPIGSRVYYLDHNMRSDQLFYQVESEQNLVLLRQPNLCGIFQLNYGEPSIEKLHSVVSHRSYLSARINKFSLDEFATLSSDFIISTQDITKACGKRAIQMAFSKRPQPRGSVHYHDCNVLVVSQGDSVYLVDLRESVSNSQSNTPQWDITKSTEMLCSQIFSSAQGQSLHYVCTNHHILSLDIRKGWCKRWSHGLPHSPSLMSLVTNQTMDESLFVGCMDEGCIVYVDCASSRDCDVNFIKTPPFSLPTIRDTLLQARAFGSCLSPLIKPRFFMPLTGLASSQSRKNEYNVFLGTCSGDLYSQKVFLTGSRTDDKTTLNNNDIEILNRWEDQLFQQLNSSTQTTIANDVASCSQYVNLFEATAESPDSKLLPNPSHSLVGAKEPWGCSRQRMETFHDVLAEKLLSCWEMEEGGEDDEWIDVGCNLVLEDSESSEEEVTAHHLVQQWLTKCADVKYSDDEDNSISEVSLEHVIDDSANP